MPAVGVAVAIERRRSVHRTGAVPRARVLLPVPGVLPGVLPGVHVRVPLPPLLPTRVLRLVGPSAAPDPRGRRIALAVGVGMGRRRSALGVVAIGVAPWAAAGGVVMVIKLAAGKRRRRRAARIRVMPIRIVAVACVRRAALVMMALGMMALVMMALGMMALGMMALGMMALGMMALVCWQLHRMPPIVAGGVRVRRRRQLRRRLLLVSVPLHLGRGRRRRVSRRWRVLAVGGGGSGCGLRWTRGHPGIFCSLVSANVSRVGCRHALIGRHRWRRRPRFSSPAVVVTLAWQAAAVAVLSASVRVVASVVVVISRLAPPLVRVVMTSVEAFALVVPATTATIKIWRRLLRRRHVVPWVWPVTEQGPLASVLILRPSLFRMGRATTHPRVVHGRLLRQRYYELLSQSARLRSVRRPSCACVGPPQSPREPRSSLHGSAAFMLVCGGKTNCG